jgi:hypothetical protein
MGTFQSIKFAMYALLWIVALEFQEIAYSQTDRVVSAGVQIDLKLDQTEKIATFTFIDASTAKLPQPDLQHGCSFAVPSK